jgi:hypothetical protein
MNVVEKNRVKINGIIIIILVIQYNDISDSNESCSGESHTTNSDKLIFESNNDEFFQKPRSLHSSFLYLKKQLKLDNFKRKTQIDSLLKKCKSKAFKTIHEALKNCMKVKLQRLPQSFITNIKIEFNKKYLDLSIFEIYRENKIFNSIDEFIENEYVLEDKINVFRKFLCLTFTDVFDSYVASKQYIKDYHHIKKREGEPFAILFNFISKVFIQYYRKSKGNRHILRKSKSAFVNRKEKVSEIIFEIRKLDKRPNA